MMCFSKFFEKWSKLDQTLAMPVMLAGTARIIDIADVSESQGALDQTLAMLVMPVGTDRIDDIADVS